MKAANEIFNFKFLWWIFRSRDKFQLENYETIQKASQIIFLNARFTHMVEVQQVMLFHSFGKLIRKTIFEVLLHTT